MVALVEDIGTVQGGRFGSAQGQDAASYLASIGALTPEQQRRIGSPEASEFPATQSQQMFEGEAARKFLTENGIALPEQTAQKNQTVGVSPASPHLNNEFRNTGNGQVLEGQSAQQFLRDNGIATDQQIDRHQETTAAKSTRVADHHKDGRARAGDPAAIAHTPEVRALANSVRDAMKSGGSHAQNAAASRSGPDKSGRGV